jgi:hypothetical protein
LNKFPRNRFYLVNPCICRAFTWFNFISIAYWLCLVFMLWKMTFPLLIMASIWTCWLLNSPSNVFESPIEIKVFCGYEEQCSACCWWTIDVLHSIVQEYYQQVIVIVTWFRVTFYLDRAQIIFCMFELSGYFLSSYNFPILLDWNKLVYYWQTSIWSLRQYVRLLDCIDIMEAKTVAEYQVVACFLVNWGTVRCLFCFKISFFQHGAKSSGRILRKHQL